MSLSSRSSSSSQQLFSSSFLLMLSILHAMSVYDFSSILEAKPKIIIVILIQREEYESILQDESTLSSQAAFVFFRAS
jgi:hypothetical protein